MPQDGFVRSALSRKFHQNNHRKGIVHALQTFQQQRVSCVTICSTSLPLSCTLPRCTTEEDPLDTHNHNGSAHDAKIPILDDSFHIPSKLNGSLTHPIYHINSLCYHLQQPLHSARNSSTRPSSNPHFLPLL